TPVPAGSGSETTSISRSLTGATRSAGTEGHPVHHRVLRAKGGPTPDNAAGHASSAGLPVAMASARVGSDGCAPGRVQAAAATLTAHLVAASTESPPASASARPPQNASPAAVVSTTRTGTAGTKAVRPCSTTRAPSAPS